MTKRKKTNPKKNTRRKSTKTKKSNNKLIAFLLFIIVLLLLAIGFLIYTIDKDKLKKTQKEIPKIVKNIETEVKKTHDEFDKYFEQIEKIKKDKFEEYTKDFYKEYSDTENIENIKKKKDIKKEKLKDKPKAIITNKPKLAIIFDDITTQHQINKINNIGYITNISVMPPSKNHPNSAKITKDLPFYLIHLPLEARAFKNEEANTLHINDTYERIEKRVATIRELYPNAKYTNNHTGSKFTANEKAMDYLFKALNKYDFTFIDSRTTSKSVAKKMAKKYNMPYISRNVFLDNEQDFNYIQGQLKKAIKIAKKNGFAIAICHPHSITIKTLKESKHLLDGLEMIHVNQLPFL